MCVERKDLKLWHFGNISWHVSKLFKNLNTGTIFFLVGCHVKFLLTHTAGEHVIKFHCSALSVTKNQGNRMDVR